MNGGDAGGALTLPDLFRGINFIDAHHHFWDLGRFPYRWLAPSAPPARFGDKSPIRHDYLPSGYLSDMSGLPLTGSVHVQANCGAADPVEETRWLQELAEQTGWPSAAVAEVDLLDPLAPDLIERHAAYPLLKGFRTPVAWDAEGRWRVAAQPHVLTEATFGDAARQIAARGLTLEMVVVPSQLIEVAEFAAAHPGLKIVINHFATLEPALPGNADTWRRGIERLADARNVYVKLSGLWTADRAWNAQALQPYITALIATLGARRVMWGSNLPVEGVNCPLQQQIEQLAIMLAGCSHQDLARIFHATAQEVYQLAID